VTEPRTVIVLAAGEGKRMRSALPKVLHPLLGRTLLGHVLAATGRLEPERVVVVVGHGSDHVTTHLAEVAPAATAVLQAEQRGTGHAARIAVAETGITDGTVVIINGDLPLLRAQTLAGLVEAHETAGAAATILTAELANPYGLGRIIRNDLTGLVDAIVEERDATPAQRACTRSTQPCWFRRSANSRPTTIRARSI
jgi:bifunctional UDP-N-acetylglucosamine pyrophosphorylase / glucosamine-1-phosphate N-acetyltransferase